MTDKEVRDKFEPAILEVEEAAKELIACGKLTVDGKARYYFDNVSGVLKYKLNTLKGLIPTVQGE
jgi:hypothetical protein